MIIIAPVESFDSLMAYLKDRPIPDHIQKIIDAPNRDKCQYCGHNHNDYAWDEQLMNLSAITHQKRSF